MRNIVTISVCICISFIVLGNTYHSNNNTANDKEQLLQLEYNWLKAEFALDTAYLSSLMDSTFTSISDEGVHNKQKCLESMYNNISQRLKDSIVIDSFNFENTVVNLYENAAVIILTVHTHGKNKGVLRDRKTRFYDVWIKRNGEWKAVSSQGTPA